MRIREGVQIHESAEVHDEAVIGRGTRVWNLAQIREHVTIGEDCVISKDVYIDSGVSVYRGVTLEDDCFVGPHAAFTNDATPRAFSAGWAVVPTFVRRGASIGSNATLVCGITLGPYSMIAAGSTATNDVPPHGLVIGSPARLVAYICRLGHRMKPSGPLDWQGEYECAECRERLTVTYLESSL